MTEPNRWAYAGTSRDEWLDTCLEAWGRGEAGIGTLPSGALVIYGVEFIEVQGVKIIMHPTPPDIAGPVIDLPTVPEPRYGRVTASPNLLIRYEPGGQIIGRFPFGTVIGILDEEQYRGDMWYYVPYNDLGGRGWVHGGYVEEVAEGSA